MPSNTSFKSLQSLHEFMHSSFLTEKASPTLLAALLECGYEFEGHYMEWIHTKTTPTTKTTKTTKTTAKTTEFTIIPVVEATPQIEQVEEDNQSNTSTPSTPCQSPTNSEWPKIDSDGENEEDEHQLPHQEQVQVITTVSEQEPIEEVEVVMFGVKKNPGRPISAHREIGFILIQGKQKSWTNVFRTQKGKSYYKTQKGAKQYIKDKDLDRIICKDSFAAVMGRPSPLNIMTTNPDDN